MSTVKVGFSRCYEPNEPAKHEGPCTSECGTCFTICDILLSPIPPMAKYIMIVDEEDGYEPICTGCVHDLKAEGIAEILRRRYDPVIAEPLCDVIERLWLKIQIEAGSSSN